MKGCPIWLCPLLLCPLLLCPLLLCPRELYTVIIYRTVYTNTNKYVNLSIYKISRNEWDIKKWVGYWEMSRVLNNEWNIDFRVNVSYQQNQLIYIYYNEYEYKRIVC
jgi:hypothetical protein